MDLAIRRATPRDKRAVNEISRHIWRGQDYLPRVFDDWVKDRRGGVWLGLLDGRVVGVGKLTLLGDGEAWLHALRVHPRFRGRGLARALIEHRLARAKRLGARIARFDTGDENAAMHHLARRLGFRRVGRYVWWTRAARAGGPPRRATPRDEAAIWRLVRENSDGIHHSDYARRQLTRADVRTSISRGRCLVAEDPPRAAALVTVDEDGLRVQCFAGHGRALRELAAGLAAEARRRGERRVWSATSARHWRTLAAAGYRRTWSGSLLLFEKRL